MNEGNRRIFEMARSYLLSLPEVSAPMLARHLNQWKRRKPTSLNELLFGMLDSVRNKRAMPRSIGPLESLKPYLEDFNPRRVVTKYGSDWRESWQKLFCAIEASYTPPGRMDIDTPQNFWVVFCKAAISASGFLSGFSSVQDFDRFVSQFYLNEYTRVALPLVLDREIFGLGFALACDFLKENGYPKFVKPDLQIKYIFTSLKLSKPQADDYEVFKDVVRFSESINEVPYVVDKLFWLVGSGYFYLDGIRIKTDTARFFDEVKRQIGLG